MSAPLGLDALDPERLSLLSTQELAYVLNRAKWLQTARDKQLPPETDWSEWGVLAGRGFGKTLLGANWIYESAMEDPEALPSAVIAPTRSDVLHTCFEGPAGILASAVPGSIVKYNRQDLMITVTGGATIRGFSAEEPERLRGPQHARIWCFVAGTKVSTPEGTKPIETLHPGDLVITRKGPRRVLANVCRAGQSVGRVGFSTGAELVGTADHPVYANAGWTRLDRLRAGDWVCAAGALTGAASGGTATATAITSGRTSLFARSARFASTVPCGPKPTALCPTATMFTTATKTRATTLSAILSACRTVGTRLTISSLRPYRARIGALLRTCSSPARAVLQSWFESAPPRPLYAGLAAKSWLTSSGESPAYAGVAARAFSPVPELCAASVVSTWRPEGRQPVYCLKVEGEPEYFANGVLVHNCDELAAWQYADETWDMAMMGLRLGAAPKVVWTTTPKPRDIIRKLTTPKPRRVLVNGTTFENKEHLPQIFFDQLEQYEGTRLGRQELLGELIDPEESGIIKRSWLRMWPSDKALPHFEFILMSLDTAFTEKTQDKKTHDPDHSACTVWGVFRHTDNKKHILLLDAWQEQLGLPDLIKRTKRELNCSYGDDNDTALIKPMFGAAKPVTSGRKPDMLVIEDKGSGISLRQMLEREHILAYAYNPGRADKLTRLHVVSPAFARRFVWIPESAKNKGRFTTWSEAVIQQLCAFAGSGSLKHDDFVDSTTQAIRLLMDKGLIDMTKALKKPAEEASPPPKQRVNPYAQ